MRRPEDLECGQEISALARRSAPQMESQELHVPKSDADIGGRLKTTARRLRYDAVAASPRSESDSCTRSFEGAGTMPLLAVMMGAPGAVGRQVVGALTGPRRVEALTLLNRRPLPDIAGPIAKQHTVDVLVRKPTAPC